MQKQILVFSNGGELLHHFTYKTKKKAKANFNIFNKYGLLCPITGEARTNLKIELI